MHFLTGPGFRFSRRVFLASSAGLAAVMLDGVENNPTQRRAFATELDVNEPAIPIVDTHQHLWDLSRLRLSWTDAPQAKHLRRNFLIADYDEATAGANIVKTVYMEVDCDPTQHDTEAEYVIGLCRTPGSRLRGAVIGGSPHTGGFRKYVEKYAETPEVKGVRMVLHNADRPKGMCLEPQFVENIRLLGRLDLSFDLCMRPAEVIDGVRLIEKCPQTRFIIDHCGNMDVQSTDAKLQSAWQQGMKGAAVHANVMCKISGIVVTAKPMWKPDDLAAVVNFCLETFGPDRVFFGGDWPVCTLRASYRQWLEALQTIVQGRSHEFRRKLFHENAERFYKLG